MAVPGQARAQRGRWGPIDGMRALGVAMVMAFHLSLDTGHVHRFEGGFLGVDVFFVISGFLITTMLTRELDRGRIRLKRFYSNRALRLSPPLLLSLAFVAALTPFVTAGIRHDTWVGLPFAAFYLMDFFVAFEHVHVYNDPGGLLLHTWSLAIEEQFYLLWPAGLALLARAKLRRSTMARIVLGAAVAVMVARTGAVLEGVSELKTYYFFFLHCDGLLLGCALGLGLTGSGGEQRSGRRWVRLGAMAGLAVLIVELLVVDQSSRWAMTVAAPAAVTASALLCWSTVRAPVPLLTDLLGNPVMRWIGERSYALYLVHFPIFLFVQIQFFRHGERFVVPVAIAASVVAAALIHRLVEVPVNAYRHRRFAAAGVTRVEGPSRSPDRGGLVQGGCVQGGRPAHARRDGSLQVARVQRLLLGLPPAPPEPSVGTPVERSG